MGVSIANNGSKPRNGEAGNNEYQQMSRSKERGRSRSQEAELKSPNDAVIVEETSKQMIHSKLKKSPVRAPTSRSNHKANSRTSAARSRPGLMDPINLGLPWPPMRSMNFTM